MICMIVIFCFSIWSAEAHSANSDVPECYTIPYEEGMETTGDADGADAYDHALDHVDSRYYIINDYYNMKSENGLHILSEFETYQQTTEYSCGGSIGIDGAESL